MHPIRIGTSTEIYPTVFSTHYAPYFFKTVYMYSLLKILKIKIRWLKQGFL